MFYTTTIETIKKILEQENVLFVKSRDYRLTLNLLEKTFIDVHYITESETLFKEINQSEKAIFITTNMLNSLSPTQLVFVHYFCNNTRQIKWIDIGDSLRDDLRGIVPYIDALPIERQAIKERAEVLFNDIAQKHFKGLKMCEVEMLARFAKTESEVIKGKARFLSLNHIQHITDSITEDRVGGCNNYKKWINKILKVKQKFHTDVIPRGAILFGWPGAGKSHLAKYTATMLNENLYKFDLGRVMSSYLGESERNLRSALNLLEVLSPCVLWLDELDKFFVGWKTDNTGVIARLLGELLFFLQEHREEIFTVATVNHFDSIPVEFYRKGRFTELWCVPLPSAEVRKEIFTIYMNPGLFSGIDDTFLNELASITEGFTPSEICEVIKSLTLDAYYTEKKVKPQDVIDMIKTTTPLTKMRERDYKKFLKFVKTYNLKEV